MTTAATVADTPIVSETAPSPPPTPERSKVAAASPAAPVEFVGTERVDPAFHDGRLRWAVGVHHYQATRANRTNSGECDWFGFTYWHQPYLAYWNGRFYLSAISGPHSEPIPPQHTMMLTSEDGRTWSRPKPMFPIVTGPDGKLQHMHQRMGWYCASNGRLLGVGFYGSNDGMGLGRVVREVKRNGDFGGGVYFVRVNTGAGWQVDQLPFPMYTASGDAGFVEACDALLADKLVTCQWYEDEKDATRDGFHSLSGTDPGQAKALSSYRLPDGTVVALAKFAWALTTHDGGESWSAPAKCPSLVMSGQKVWGERTADGRYALVYNPTEDNTHRWPLAIVSGDDGRRFADMLCVQGEVPPRRFVGIFKDYGPQYVRGIEARNGPFPGNDLWLTYSMNKDDIWVARVPLPVRGVVDEPVDDDFNGMTTGGHVPDWNIYSPQWAPVRVVEFPHPWDKSLELRDEDRGDYARAVRVFPGSIEVRLSLKLHARQTSGSLHVWVQDRYGNRPVRLTLAEGGRLMARDGSSEREVGAYVADRWHALELRVRVANGTFDIAWDGRPVAQGLRFADAEVAGETTASVERLSLCTGDYRTSGPPDGETPVSPKDHNWSQLQDVPGVDRKAPAVVFNVDDVRIIPLERPSA